MISPRELLDEGTKREDHPAESFWASGLGSCQRKQIFKRTGVKGEPFDERARRVFGIGDAVERWVKETIEKSAERMGVTILGYSVPVATQFEDITGKMDVLIRQPDWTPEVWEVKSINSMSFKYKDLPLPQHRVQITFYEELYDLDFVRQYKNHPKDAPPHDNCGKACVLRTEPYEPIAPFSKWPKKGELTQGRMVYVSKDDALIEDPIIALTSESREQLWDEIHDLRMWQKEHNAVGTLPPILEFVPVLEKGQPFVYKKAGAWGPAGTVKKTWDFECHRGNGSKVKCPFFDVCFGGDIDNPATE